MRRVLIALLVGLFGCATPAADDVCRHAPGRYASHAGLQGQPEVEVWIDLAAGGTGILRREDWRARRPETRIAEAELAWTCREGQVEFRYGTTHDRLRLEPALRIPGKHGRVAPALVVERAAPRTLLWGTLFFDEDRER